MNNSSSAGKTSMVGVYILSLISVILWGMSYLWSDKLLSLGLPVEYVVFIRIFIASFLLLGYNLVKKYRIAISKKDLPKFLLLSLFEPFIYFVAETYGIKYTESPTISALIIASTPIFSVIVGVLIFKERFSLMNMFGILICLAGIVMVTLCTESITEGGFILGIVLLLVAVFAEVGYASVTKYLSNDYHPAVIVMYQFFIGSVYLLPIFLTKGIANYDASLYMSWQYGSRSFILQYCALASPLLCGQIPSSTSVLQNPAFSWLSSLYLPHLKAGFSVRKYLLQNSGSVSSFHASAW